MHYIFAALMAVHGLLHLLGFARAFDLVQTSRLQTAIPRPMGLLWLAAALLLVAGGGMFLLSGRGWWVPALLGVVLSQFLIYTAWGDAKPGTIANVILMAPIMVALLGTAPWSLRAAYNREVEDGLGGKPPSVDFLTQMDAAHLPIAVQRYLRFTGSMGEPKVWNYRLRFRGALRNGPDDKWMPMKARQQSFTNPPARLFLVESSMFGVPLNALHRYVGREATFRVKLASLLSVLEARGAEMNESETVTLLNDMFLFAPATLIDPIISWKEIDSQTVRATLTNEGNTVSAVVTFDDSGALVNFVSGDRYRTIDGKSYERQRWSTPVSGWRDFDGRKLPAKARAIWTLPEGGFAYAMLEVVDVQYNVTEN